MPEPTETPTPAAELESSSQSAASAPAAATPAVDVQAEVNKALAENDAKREAALRAELKELTGFSSLKEFKDAQLAEQGKVQELLDSKSAELAAVTKRFHSAQIKTALLAAASASVDPDIVVSLLESQCQCDENGQVTVNGQQPADAVKALLEAKPVLAKPSGDPGSGAPQNAGAVEKNPWSQADFNLTEQIRIQKTNPSKAAQLKAAASQ